MSNANGKRGNDMAPRHILEVVGDFKRIECTTCGEPLTAAMFPGGCPGQNVDVQMDTLQEMAGEDADARSLGLL